MFEPEDFEPRHGKPKLRDLTPLSIEELREYIGTLEAEIARAEQAITKKEAHRSGLDNLFGGR